MPKTPFEKPALSLDDQLALLKGRGLAVDDDAVARRYLEYISYYRLSGYTRYFTRGDDERREQFREGVSFSDVVALYVFDRRIRNLLAEAFERIEIAVKGSLAYQGAIASGPFWITEPDNFDRGRHPEVLKLVTDAVIAPEGKHKTQFLDAFYRKYDDNYPPAWMITEVLSFHGISIVYKLAKGAVRKPVADRFEVQQDTLESWLHALVFARNICAHHQRFWNRKLTIKPRIPNPYRGVWPEAAQDRLYITCCIAKHMLDRIPGEGSWGRRLRLLINERPGVPLSQMGFPDDWENGVFWMFD